MYNKYSPSIYGMILKLTPDSAIATDILKRSFVMCWNDLDRYNPSNGRLFTCLLNIAVQECAKELRQPKQILLQKLLPSAKQVNRQPVAA
jgi:RNA polymerase sigma-70 factor (ECF subfamily)